jgi:hypothetical protein
MTFALPSWVTATRVWVNWTRRFLFSFRLRQLVAQADFQLTSLAEAQRAVDKAIRLNPNLPGVYTLKGIIADYQHSKGPS